MHSGDLNWLWISGPDFIREVRSNYAITHLSRDRYQNWGNGFLEIQFTGMGMNSGSGYLGFLFCNIVIGSFYPGQQDSIVRKFFPY
jgi:hypothetical protein